MPGCALFLTLAAPWPAAPSIPRFFGGGRKTPSFPQPHPLVGQCPCLPRHHAQSLTAETQDPIDSLSPFYITWRSGREKGRQWGQPQGSELALGALGGARCQTEGVPGMRVLCLDAPFHHGPQNCPSVCPGGCTADGKKQPEGRKGDKGRWWVEGGAHGALCLPCMPSVKPLEKMPHSHSLPAWTELGCVVPALRREDRLGGTQFWVFSRELAPACSCPGAWSNA